MMSEAPVLTQSASGTAFVIMPFKEPFNSYYAGIIKPALYDINYKAHRSDEIFSPQAFVQTIWDEILACGLVIAEMTSSNPNVLYELGLAHAIGKRVVMITRRLADVPADLRHINCIVYDTAQVGWELGLRRAIQEMVLSRSITRSLLSPVAAVENAKAVADAERSVADLTVKLESMRTENSALEEANTRYLIETQEVRNALELRLSIGKVASSPVTRSIAYGKDEGGRDLAFLNLGDGTMQEFVRVPAGRFVCGFGPNAVEEDLSEYWISRYSVTNRQFAYFLRTCGNRIEANVPWMDLNGRSAVDKCNVVHDGERFLAEKGFEEYPATYINYYGASAYCAWIGGELPSSEMWERASRGDDGRAYPWGKTPPTRSVANVNDDGEWSRDVTPIDVHEKRAGVSPHGVIQPIGNVWHWTSTFFPDRDVQVVRGGTGFDYRLGNRRVYRFQVSPDGPDLSQGILPVIRML